MKNEVDERLQLEFEPDAEWKAYQTRIARILKKRNNGNGLNKEESAMLADYKVACSLSRPPMDRTGAVIPPILYGYNEAVEAFGLDRQQLYQLRTEGSAAFAGNLILSATLSEDIRRNPNPKRAPLNAIHTGRGGKLTKELQDSIVEMLGRCPVLTTVAGAHGITAAVISQWRTKGAAGEKKYVDFFNATEAALQQARAGLVQKITTDPDWRAALAILERTQPQEYGRVHKLQHSGPDGQPLAPATTAPAITVVLNGVPQQATTAPAEDFPPLPVDDDEGA